MTGPEPTPPTHVGLLTTSLVLIGVGAVGVSLFGPLVAHAIDYHASAGATDQVRGGDVAGLLLVAPASWAAAWLVRSGRPGGPALALAPASYGLYMYTQLAIAGDYGRYPGNSERWFPLFWALIVLCGTTVVVAGSQILRLPPPEARPRLERVIGWYLVVVAAFLTVGLHLPGLRDAWRAAPTSEEYLADPVVFWVVKVMDLAYVVPFVTVVGVGLLRRRPWARRLLAPVAGWCALLATSVAGMGITMLVTGAAGSSAGLAVGFAVAAAAALILATLAYRPVLSPGVGDAPASA